MPADVVIIIVIWILNMHLFGTDMGIYICTYVYSIYFIIKACMVLKCQCVKIENFLTWESRI